MGVSLDRIREMRRWEIERLKRMLEHLSDKDEKQMREREKHG